MTRYQRIGYAILVALIPVAMFAIGFGLVGVLKTGDARWLIPPVLGGLYLWRLVVK
jgi:hypothetical protein